MSQLPPRSGWLECVRLSLAVKGKNTSGTAGLDKTQIVHSFPHGVDISDPHHTQSR